MSTAEKATGTPTEVDWYAKSAEDTATAVGVDPSTGLSGSEAAARLAKNGPNALAAEAPPPGWKLFLAQLNGESRGQVARKTHIAHYHESMP